MQTCGPTYLQQWVAAKSFSQAAWVCLNITLDPAALPAAVGCRKEMLSSPSRPASAAATAAAAAADVDKDTGKEAAGSRVFSWPTPAPDTQQTKRYRACKGGLRRTTGAYSTPPRYRGWMQLWSHCI